MKEIKFRGYSQTFNCWSYGDLLITRQPATIVCEESGHEYEVEHDSVGQFTGLHDKNGKEIYEGEILYNNDREEHCIVKYYEEKAMFIVKYLESNDEFTLWESISNLYYSVGNIFENPELLIN